LDVVELIAGYAQGFTPRETQLALGVVVKIFQRNILRVAS
jgi:hypothetical protein